MEASTYQDKYKSIRDTNLIYAREAIVTRLYTSQEKLFKNKLNVDKDTKKNIDFKKRSV